MKDKTTGKRAKPTAAKARATARGSKPSRVPLAATKKFAAKGLKMRRAKFAPGDVVRHRFYPFRGVIFDIDPVFNNSDEWWLAIPETMRPKKDQPFYHLLAENDETEYIAYVSEQNLQPDESGEPLRHPRLSEYFSEDETGRYRLLQVQAH